MNNVVDRVPTQVLSNGAIRWEQFDANGNSLGYVYLKRADEPSVAGTTLNKVLFDSIKTDLTNLSNNKLNVSAKSTQAQAEAGTDNTDYMTALRTKQAIQKLQACQILFHSNLEPTATSLQDIYTFDNSKNNLIKITGQMWTSYGSYSTHLYLNGTGINGRLWGNDIELEDITSSSSAYNGVVASNTGIHVISNDNKNYSSNPQKTMIDIEIDFETKTFKVEYAGHWYYSNSNQGTNYIIVMGTFDTLTDIKMKVDHEDRGGWNIKGYQIG